MTHPDSRWTHPLCADCFHAIRRDAEPFRLIEREREICCRCGSSTASGIYYRGDPFTMNFRACPAESRPLVAPSSIGDEHG